MYRRHTGPLAGDDLLELGPEQVLVGTHQFDELLVRGSGTCGSAGMDELDHRRDLDLRR
jgi:hypothetical protein